MNSTGYFELQIKEDGRVVQQFASPDAEGYVLGRSDTNNPYVPDIDLASFGALEHGISRRHAALVRFRNNLCVLDLGSANGTFLNGQRIQPERPYPVQENAQIKLGSLVLTLVKIG